MHLLGTDGTAPLAGHSSDVTMKFLIGGTTGLNGLAPVAISRGFMIGTIGT